MDKKTPYQLLQEEIQRFKNNLTITAQEKPEWKEHLIKLMEQHERERISDFHNKLDKRDRRPVINPQSNFDDSFSTPTPETNSFMKRIMKKY